MTIQILIVLTVICLAFVLFWTEALAVEMVGMLALVVLVLTGILEAGEAFSGFGDSALITIASILVLSASLVRNGAGERIAFRIQRLSGGHAELMACALFSTVLAVSAFINNVAATAMFIPVAEILARASRVRPSRLLMPVAYASLLGGVCTLTGTSTNVAVSGMLQKSGLPGIGVFELSPVGIPLALVGMIYLVVFSRWLPGKAGIEGEQVNTDVRKVFITELAVEAGSWAAGRTLRELDLEQHYRLSPLGLIRGSVRLVEGVLDTRLKPGDVVVVEGDAPAINRGAQAAGLTRKKSHKSPPVKGEPALVEATISYDSPLIGRTLAEVDPRGRYGLDVIAAWRRGGPMIEKIGRIRLRLGDDLLILGPLDRIRQIARDPLNLLLDDKILPRYDGRKELLSLLIFGCAIALGAFRVLPIPLAFVAGALAVVLTRCMTLEEAYRSLNLKLIVLIGSMIGVSLAISSSGTADWLARTMVEGLGGDQARPLWLLAGMYWLTVLLTQSMSNAAAALIVVPVALATAAQLGAPARPFAVTVAVAASLAFMTPLEPACLLVMSTGRYGFRHFLRFGAPLTAICFVLVMFLVPLWFPLYSPPGAEGATARLPGDVVPLEQPLGGLDEDPELAGGDLVLDLVGIEGVGHGDHALERVDVPGQQASIRAAEDLERAVLDHLGVPLSGSLEVIASNDLVGG